jgi:hypothetical protein
MNHYLRLFTALYDEAGDSGGTGTSDAGSGQTVMQMLDAAIASADKAEATPAPVTKPSVTAPTTSVSASDITVTDDDDETVTVDDLLDGIDLEAKPADAKDGKVKPIDAKDEGVKDEEDKPDPNNPKLMQLKEHKYRKWETGNKLLGEIQKEIGVELTPESLPEVTAKIRAGETFDMMLGDFTAETGGDPARLAKFLISESRRVEQSSKFDSSKGTGVSPTRVLLSEMLRNDDSLAADLKSAAGQDFLVETLAAIYAEHKDAAEDSDEANFSPSVLWICRKLGINPKTLEQTSLETAQTRADRLARELDEERNKSSKQQITEGLRTLNTSIGTGFRESIEQYVKTVAPKVVSLAESNESFKSLLNIAQARIREVVFEELSKDADLQRRIKVQADLASTGNQQAKSHLQSLYKLAISEKLNPVKRDTAAFKVLRDAVESKKAAAVGKLQTRVKAAESVSTTTGKGAATGNAIPLDFTVRQGESKFSAGKRLLDQVLG